jgi:hypothetical protein
MADIGGVENTQNNIEKNAHDGEIVNPLSTSGSIPETDLNTADESRELTQTDYLNKRLLSSFLERLNQMQPCPNVSDDSAAIGHEVNSDERSEFDEDVTGHN